MSFETNPNKQLTFEFEGQTLTKKWISENSFSPPQKVMVIDDSFSANRYTNLASQGVSFVWKGDYQNAKQLLQAVQRRIKRPTVPMGANQSANQSIDPESMSKAFYRHRQHQAYNAQLLSRLMVHVEVDFSIRLPRAPDLSQAISEALAHSMPGTDFLLSLRELQGFVGAHEWRKKGVAIAALAGKKIHAHYGVFSPVRGEYLDLVAKAPLVDSIHSAFDIGTGTGVISAVLASRGIQKIVATDMDDRAIQCASENIKNLGFDQQITIQKTNLFPEETADLIVCNPPWLPAKPTSSIERAVYDEDNAMIKGFLAGVRKHLNENGEAWLIISDLAEHLGLRASSDLSNWIKTAKLEVVDCLKIQPRHSKSADVEDPLHVARSQEMTMLWRLKKL
jgi:methylase of polypeptide subunit release factors